KKEVAEVLVEFVEPFQDRVRTYLDDPDELDRVLAQGAEKARAVASETLAKTYDRVGFLPPVTGRTGV
ncbi:tryptophan--tRNA ligase, partial [Streptomyces microflavus]